MKARLLKRNKKVGIAPGTLQAPRGALAPSMTLFAFDPDRLEERPISSVEEIKSYLGTWPVVWVNVDGLGDAGVIAALGDMFGLHPLALEDVLTVPQRAKTEDYGDHIFTILRMVMQKDGNTSLEQLSIFWGKNFVLTIQEDPGDVFDPVRERLRKGGKRIRMSHADYMAYALIDAVVDGFFPVLETLGDRLDMMEQRILDDPSQEAMNEIHRTKRELHALRLCTWPMREALGKINSDSRLVRKETLLFLRDCQDHMIQILDIIENYRERLSSLSDLYLSSISNRMNEVMKVLTIISTIFMPLTFIVGVYGMNFNTDSPFNMPELNYRYGYPLVMAVMAATAVAMLMYFRAIGWLGGSKKKA